MRNSGYNPQVLQSYDEDLYFPKQVITNACATQAILSVLMNIDEKIDIGPHLQELKSFTQLMDPYMKGLAISNCEKVKEEHNKFARPIVFQFEKNESQTEEGEIFHFVAYLHFKNSIYELDGLREGPILIKENVNSDEWVQKLTPVIYERISLYATNEIKFNLLAMIPEKRKKAEEREKDLSARLNYVRHLQGKENEVPFSLL